MTPVRVGVAGWDYPDWRGVLYPEPRPRGFDPLPFLGRYLDLVEINSTFYGPARPETAARWAERVRGLPGFRFTAKLWRRFTHERSEAWTRADADLVRRGMDVLHDAGLLDALLLQFPWSFRNTPQERDWLSDLVATFNSLPLVIEVRHESWNDAAFFAWLRAECVGFVNVDQPLFKRSIKPSARATATVGYVRVHGRNYQDWFRKNAGRDARYDYLYEPTELESWVERTESIARGRHAATVDVVFNNHYRAQAVVNALQFKALLDGAPVEAPPTLHANYGAQLAGLAC